MKIGVFDSGVGGLTVLKDLVDNFNNEYVYLADLKNSPYGEKTEEYLENVLIEILDYFISAKVDLIIIACGTISSIAIKLGIKEYKGIKVLNVIDAVKYDLKDNVYDNILLMATLSTINQKRFAKYISNNANNIIECPCPLFVPLIENGNLSKEEKLNVVQKYITEDIKQKIKENSAIILGCTHYPILKEEIEEVSNLKNVILPGKAMVRYIIENNLLTSEEKLKTEFRTTKNSKILNKFVNKYFNETKVTEI